MTSICYYTRSITAAKSTKRNQDHRERMDSIQYLAGRKYLSVSFRPAPWWVETAAGLRKTEQEGGGTGAQRTIEGWTRLFYRRNINIQRPKLNYLYVIHPTSESSMWISKRLRFDEIFASTVSDWPLEQRFKKSNFDQLWSLILIFFWCYNVAMIQALCWNRNMVRPK
jgi:hypothetical protein